MRLAGVVVVALVVLAGCSASLPGTGTQPLPETATPDPSNPWAGATLTVTVDAPEDQQARYRTLTRRALRYWNDSARQYVGYDVGFRLVNDSDARIRITFVDTVQGCHLDEHTAGCAPLVEHPQRAPDPVTVQVKRGFDDASTVFVVKHELGHVLGMNHDEGPRKVMASVSDLDTLPRPNATERSLPWADARFTVAVVEDPGTDRNETRVEAQLDAVFDYYERGAEGTVPADVRFVRVANASEADVVVRFQNAADCAPDGGSCNEFSGPDPDGDGALERYRKQRITLVNTDTEAVAWHVGYWLAPAFGLDTQTERPPVLRRTVDPLVRRSDWWAE